jgi:hypothetical protein
MSHTPQKNSEQVLKEVLARGLMLLRTHDAMLHDAAR